MSKRNKRAEEQAVVTETEDSSADRLTESSTEDIMKLMMLQFEYQKQERAAEKERREEEKAADREQAQREREAELERQRLELERLRYEAETREHRHMEELKVAMTEITLAQNQKKLPKMEPIKDTNLIDVELSRFERIMKSHCIPVERWMGHLTPLLTGDALVAVESLGSDVPTYEDAKTAILSHLGITQDLIIKRW